MNKIQIACESDLEGVNNIRQAVREDKNDPHTIKDYEVGDILENNHQVTFLSKDQNKVTGFLNMHKHHTLENNDVAIIELFIHHQYRCQGIGEYLIRFAIEYCKSKKTYSEIILSVLKNIPAIGLYKKCGFIITKEEDDGMWMSLKL
nr:N-acetyltransferase [uncultured Desulfobacter sp.]